MVSYASEKGQLYRLLITSSREPTDPMRTLMRDLHTVIPNSRRINRGKMSLSRLAETAGELGVKYVMILGRWAGSPGEIDFYKTWKNRLAHIPPVLYIKKVRLQREISLTWRKSRKRISKLAACEASTSEGQKLLQVLSEILGASIVSLRKGLGKNWAYMKVVEQGTSLRGITFYCLVDGFEEIGPSIILREVKWETPANDFEIYGEKLG